MAWSRRWRVMRVRSGVGGALCACAATAAAAAAATMLMCAVVAVTSQCTFRRHLTAPYSPRHLAHALADFTRLARIDKHLAQWRLEDERGNYTEWRYSVSWSCGPRCVGRGTVEARELHAVAGQPAHGAPHSHSVTFRRRQCIAAPLLSVLLTCDVWKTEWLVEAAAAGDGAVLSESASLQCSAPTILHLLLSGDSCSDTLRRYHDRLLHHLYQELFHAVSA